MSASTDASDTSIDQPDRILSKCLQMVSWAQRLPSRFGSHDQAIDALGSIDDQHFALSVVSPDGDHLSFYHRHFDDPNVPVLGDQVSGWCQILAVDGDLTQIEDVRQAAARVSRDGNSKAILDTISPDQTQCLLISEGRMTLYRRDTKGEWHYALHFSGGFIATDVDKLAAYLGTLHADFGAHARGTLGDLPPVGKFLTVWRASIRRSAMQAVQNAMKEYRPKRFQDFPADSRNQKVIDGRKQFQIASGHGAWQPCYLSDDGFVRPMADRSILLMHTGQSNAGIHPAGGPIPGVVKTPYHILTPDDGRSARGLMGKPPTTEITGFTPLDECLPLPLQSVTSVAASTYLAQLPEGQNWPQFIVRSEAIGGQAVIGDSTSPRRPGLHMNELGERSQCFRNLISTISGTVTLAAQEDAPVQTIYIAFTHQEADRAAERQVYAQQVTAFFADVEAHLAPLGTPIVWLLDQVPGTIRFGNWRVRLALQDLADALPNVHLIQPRYPYPLFDITHWSNRAKALYGEYLGHAIWQLEQGRRFQATKLVHAERVGRKITLRFDNSAPLVLDADYYPSPPRNFGFHVIGPKRAPGLCELRVTAATEVTLILEDTPDPSLDGKLGVQYAMNRISNDAVVPGWAAGIGCLREERGFDSPGFDGVTHHPWVPAFEVKGL